MEEMIERKLRTLAYSIQPFTDDEAINFLVRTWQTSSNECAEKLEINAKELIRSLPRLITSDSTQTLGMPLPISMAAEV